MRCAGAGQPMRRRLDVAAGALACALLASLLQGCNKEPGCRIQDVYEQLLVNDKRGFTREQLERAGVWLCARHSARPETYKGKECCSRPEEVFHDGEIPDMMVGDSQALLLLRCPSTTYPGTGEIKQRITCAKDFYFDDPDGPMKEELALHFDAERRPASCSVDNAAWLTAGGGRGPHRNSTDRKAREEQQAALDPEVPDDPAAKIARVPNGPTELRQVAADSVVFTPRPERKPRRPRGV
mmetsp:Transcript_38726/g.121007  ORF Transcript_38726/g.121007 Transcript_38726/m.121007 type:complete len:240 (+) Transcript_38726:86-805(+)